MRWVKLLIFDFDGTIVDSKTAYYHSINLGLKDYGFSRKQIDEAIGIGLSLSETLKKLGFGWLQRIFLRKRIMSHVITQVSRIKKCHDATLVKNISCKKILVTNSLREFAVPVLKHLRLMKEFSEIYSADNFSSKEEFIFSYLRKRKINPKEVLYIGDRVADIKLARNVGCKSVVIAGKCSWDSRNSLIRNKPDFLISDLKDINKLVSN
jgi:phosphoglycolate phosphatase